ncbi:hypothetical protein [Hoeflea sp. TYP-13]|uniref:hypothetical protein n=1 Tax=Hoeflea sp. TYP-13 TaxID=3230023 RepID=UPI0034C63BAC
MEGMSGMAGVAAGLGAFGFWIFLAAVVIAGIWYDIRKKEVQHETLRRIMDSDQKIDEALLDKLLSASSGGSRRLERELRIYGVVTLFTAPGLALLGWILGFQFPPAMLPILGASVLVLFVAVGLLVAAGVVGRDQREGETVSGKLGRG